MSNCVNKRLNPHHLRFTMETFSCSFSAGLFALLLLILEVDHSKSFNHVFSSRFSGLQKSVYKQRLGMMVEATEETPSLVILPGFGNDQLDYKNPLEKGEEFGLVTALTKRGFQSSVVPVQRSDWLKVARGVISPAFWKRELKPEGICYNWYLEKVYETVAEATANSPTGTVVLVGHSAGGWLARAALGDGSASESIAKVDLAACTEGLVTLGSPHFPPAAPVDDMTFGCLTYVNDAYPGAYLKDQGLFYITVAGDVVVGNKDADRRTVESYAFGSYTAVCGEGEVTGDSVVPLQSAHLEGANQITLPSIYHSINNPIWYGSDEVVDQWLGPMMNSLQQENGLLQQDLKSGFFKQIVGSFQKVSESINR